jgi:hypothetical protein
VEETMRDMIGYVDQYHNNTFEKSIERKDDIYVYIDQEIEDLVPDFLEHKQKDVDHLFVALEREDYAKIFHIGHKLNGEGGTYGFDPITTIGRFIEMAAKDMDKAKISEMIKELSNYLERVVVVFIN